MKKIFVLFISVASVFALSSCLKDAEPTDYITQEHLDEVLEEHPEKFAALVQSIYSDIQNYEDVGQSHNYFGQMGFNYLTSLMGNDMCMTGRYGMSIYHHLLDYWQHNYNPTLIRWRENYRHIANANAILRSAPADSEDAETLYYRATALGIRAYSYLHLSYLYQFSYYVGADDTKWGKSAKYNHANDPLAPLILEDTTEDQPRATVKTIFDQIVADFKEAYEIFDAIGAVHTSDPSDFDGCVVANYLTRVYMIMHEWAEAEKYAAVIMEEFAPLTSQNDILQGFSDINLSDVVWGCDITTDNTGIYRSWFSMMDYFGDGYAGIGVWRVAFKPLVDRIADTDVRRMWFLDDRNPYKPIRAKAYQAIKFIGAGRPKVFSSATFDGTGWELGDYIYLRSEEAYFNYMECLAHEGNLEMAVAYLEAVMKTRQEDYAYAGEMTKADVIEEINFQKRVEFWGEGIEFLDNRRLNIPVDRTDATWGDANNHFSGAKLKAEQESENFLYQIPDSEIENNKMITEADQN